MENEKMIAVVAYSAGLAVLLSCAAMAGGNNGAGRSAQASENGASARGGHGVITSELASLNAAHANAKAFENAAPESMPGKLAVYSSEYLAAQAAVEAALSDLATAQSDYDGALTDLLAAQALFDALVLGDFATQEEYDAAVVLAQSEVNDAQAIFDAADTDLALAETELAAAEELDAAALDTLTDGDGLSGGAFAALLAMLGL
jgi:hypothetical protein